MEYVGFIMFVIGASGMDGNRPLVAGVMAVVGVLLMAWQQTRG